MSRCLLLFVAAACLVGVRVQAQDPAKPATPAPNAPAAADIRGVWTVTELAWSTPSGEWEIRTPSLSQYIFTEEHYSYMYAPGTRKLFAGDPNRPTDAEKVEAYNSFVAATGTYTLAGQTLTLRALVTKNPNEMVGKPLTYTIESIGKTLRMVIANPPFLPGRQSRTVLTRVE
jgi:hypothetical protein